jgi:hypothetical protein
MNHPRFSGGIVPLYWGIEKTPLPIRGTASPGK